MIMANASKQIGGSSDLKPESNQASLLTQVSINQEAENDLEDLKWLRSIGLDEPIERLPSPKNTPTSNSCGINHTVNNDVHNIDWLIMTDWQVVKYI